MLDLSRYQSIGAALKDALEEFANETCLIEADRERENHRLTYREFRDRALPIFFGVGLVGIQVSKRRGAIPRCQCPPLATLCQGAMIYKFPHSIQILQIFRQFGLPFGKLANLPRSSQISRHPSHSAASRRLKWTPFAGPRGWVSKV